MIYYADKISDNIRKREPEGYLICTNVPIARTGVQEYEPDEIGEQGAEMIKVYRPEEEVFSKATMASFEGMPVTNDHPDSEEGVNADNVQYLGKGHCQNVRRGTGKDRDLLIADLVIWDPTTIQEVLDGKREISCGYNYELSEEDGKFVQRQIRGNHIAIVDRGRAGRRVCIKDSAPNNERRKSKMAKTKHGIFAKMLAAFARDAEPEELEEAVNAIDELTTEETPVPPVPETKDEEPDKLDMINDKLDQLLAAKSADCKDEEPEEDPIAKLEDEIGEMEKVAEIEEGEEDEDPMNPEDDPDNPEAHFVDPEEINEQDEDPEDVEIEAEEITADKRACDAARKALNAIKPVIAQLPPAQRKRASDAAVAQIRQSYGLNRKPSSDGYMAIRKATRKAADRKTTDPADLGKKIMEARNANCKK